NISVCQNAASPLVTFTGSGGTAPYIFEFTLNGGAVQTITSSGNTATISVPTAAIGQFVYDLVSVTDSGANACSQSQTGTVTVNIIGLPTLPATIAPYEVCDDDNNGISCLFDLNTKTAEITGGASNLVVSYHETLTDSQTGANPISLASNYCNINAGVQTIYVRVSDVSAPACASFTSFELRVNPVAVIPPVIPDYALCDETTPGDLEEGFDLLSWIPNLVGSQTGLSVTFYESQADALSGTSPINTTVPYVNTSSPQQVWFVLETASGCQSVGAFLIRVDPLPQVSGPLTANQCGSATGVGSFNLTLNDLSASMGLPGMTVSYHLTQAEAQNDASPLASPYSNTSNPQTLYVRVE
ncbi:MAG TPA: hypothetical protein PLA69_10955, partial [Flavobacterium sp.]|nr:hypothetical protein [Flavobacterium sp.]